MNITDYVETSKKLQHADPKTLRVFIDKLTHPPYTRDEGATDHFTTYLVPFHKPTQSIFAGSHKKSGMWIPPGGHIDRDEGPLDTVVREFEEELSYKITPDRATLFQITMIDITNRPDCTRHLGFGFRIDMPEKVDFDYDRGEFYEARWFTISEFLKMKTYEAVKNEVRLLQKMP